MKELNIFGENISTNTIVYTSKTQLDCEGRFGVGSGLIEGDINDNYIEEKNNKITGHTWDEEKKTGVLVFEREVRKIGKEMFRGVPIESIYLPSDVKELAEGAFMYCLDLEEVGLPKGLKKIGKNCFCKCCSLRKINIDEEVEEVGENAFLEVVNIDYKGTKKEVWGERCRNGWWENGILYRDEKKESIVYADKDIEEVEIGDGVKRIEDRAFVRCGNLKKVCGHTNSKLEYIGKESFMGCVFLKDVDFFSNLKTIGEGCFYNCISLDTFYIGGKVKEVGDSSFEGVRNVHVVKGNKYLDKEYRWGAKCRNGVWEEGILYEDDTKRKIVAVDREKTKIVVREGVREIGVEAFMYSKMEEISLPPTLTTIHRNAFFHCDKLTSISLPSSVTHLGAFMFWCCKSLQSIEFPPTIGYIPEGCCYGCTVLYDVVLPPMLNTIRKHAFQGCDFLQKIVLPRSVEVLEEEAFSDCFHLTEIYIPDGVYKIDKNALNGVKNLKTRNQSILDGEINWGGANVMNGIWENTYIHNGGDPILIPQYFLYRYFSHNTLKGVDVNKKVDECIIVDGVKTIGKDFMRNNYWVEKVVIPKSVKCIEDGAFYNCKYLKEVEGGEGLEYIGKEAFFRCENLEHINHNNLKNVKVLGDECFYGCRKLGIGYGEDGGREVLRIGKGVEEIGEDAFCDCVSLREVEVEGELKVLKPGVFYGCEWLRKVMIKSVKEVGARAFCNCRSMEELEIGDRVEVLGVNCFGNCLKLKKIPSFERVSICKQDVFYNCISIEEVKLGKIEVLRSGTFYGCRGMKHVEIDGILKKMEEKSMYGCNGEVRVGGKEEIEFEGKWEKIPSISCKG